MSCVQHIPRNKRHAFLRICRYYYCLSVCHLSLSLQKSQKSVLPYCRHHNRCCGCRMHGSFLCGGRRMNEIVFQNRLRVARAEKRISQGDLAESVGVSRQTISSIENNQFCPSAKLAALLCIALDKKFEELFYFEEQ